MLPAHRRTSRKGGGRCRDELWNAPWPFEGYPAEADAMIAYAIRRVVTTIPVMGVVALFVFSLLYLTPGDPAGLIADDQAGPDDIARIRATLRLDRPFLVQFGDWCWRILHGDLGTSIFTHLPVTGFCLTASSDQTGKPSGCSASIRHHNART